MNNGKTHILLCFLFGHYYISNILFRNADIIHHILLLPGCEAILLKVEPGF